MTLTTVSFISALVLHASLARPTKYSDENPFCAELPKSIPDLCTNERAKQLCKNTCSRSEPLKCGVSAPYNKFGSTTREDHSRVKRVVGGSPSSPGKWPWHASLRMNGTQFCSGSILSEHFVLTAAHCFDAEFTSLKAQDWSITAGDFNFLLVEDFEQTIPVRKIIAHPGFKIDIHTQEKGMLAVADYDIAVLQLMYPVNLNHLNKGPLCLPSDATSFPDGSECTVIGWGHTQYNGTQPDILHEAKVLTVPLNICNLPMAYNGTVTARNICAGYEQGGIDACNYDSGGALVCEKDGAWSAHGIVSSGFECARPHGYGLYSNVKLLKSWLLDNILTQSVY